MTTPSTVKTKAAPASRKPSSKKKTPAPPSQAEIAKLAEQYWLERGKTDGFAEHDWLRAEQELRGKAS